MKTHTLVCSSSRNAHESISEVSEQVCFSGRRILPSFNPPSKKIWSNGLLSLCFISLTILDAVDVLAAPRNVECSLSERFLADECERLFNTLHRSSRMEGKKTNTKHNSRMKSSKKATFQVPKESPFRVAWFPCRATYSRQVNFQARPLPAAQTFESETLQSAEKIGVYTHTHLFSSVCVCVCRFFLTSTKLYAQS